MKYQHKIGGKVSRTVTTDATAANELIAKGQVEGMLNRPFKEVNAATYTIVAEDKNKYLLFRSTNCVVTLDANALITADVVKGVCYSATLVQFTSSSQIVKPSTKAAEISAGGSFEIKYNASLDAFILTGDLNPV